MLTPAVFARHQILMGHTLLAETNAEAWRKAAQRALPGREREFAEAMADQEEKLAQSLRRAPGFLLPREGG